MVRATASVSAEADRHQTALRGPAPLPIREGGCSPTGESASETSPCRRAGKARRCARPPKGSGGSKATRPGDRDPGAVGATSDTPRRQQFVAHSAVGPHRVGDGSTQVACSTPVTGAGANPSKVGSGLRRSATRGVGPHEESRTSRSPVVPQFGVSLPAPGRWFPDRPIKVRSCLLPVARGLVFGSLSR